MPYFYISWSGDNTECPECPEVPECPPQIDLLPIENAVVERGGTVNKAGDEVTVLELVAAIASIPEGAEPIDLQPLAQAIRDKGGSVEDGTITVNDLIIAIATIPDPGVSPECPMPGVPIGSAIKEIVTFPSVLFITDSVTSEVKNIPPLP